MKQTNTESALACPYNRMKPCMQSACAKWVELFQNSDDQTPPVAVGKCSDAWVPMLAIELKQAMADIPQTRPAPTSK